MPDISYSRTPENPYLRLTTEEHAPLAYVPSAYDYSTLEPEAPEMGEFRKGVARGIDELQALAGGAIGLVGDATGSDILRDFGYDIYKEQMAEAGQYAPAVESMYDIESMDSFADWLAGTAGELLPSVAGALVSGGAGGLIGAGAKQIGKEALKRSVSTTLKRTLRQKAAQGFRGRAILEETLKELGTTGTGRTLIQGIRGQIAKDATRRAAKLGTQAGVVGFSSTVESGGNWIDDYETNPGNTNPMVDLAFGVASGMTDLIGAEGLAISKLFGKNVGNKLAMEVGEQAAKQAERGFARAMVTEVVKSMAAEGGQESLQESIGILNSYLNTHSINAVMTPEIFKQVLEAGAAGAVGGAMFGGIGGVKSGFDAKAEARRIRESQALETQNKLDTQRSKVQSLSQEVQNIDSQIEQAQRIAAGSIFGVSTVSPEAATQDFSTALATEAELKQRRDELSKELNKQTDSLKMQELDIESKAQAASPLINTAARTSNAALTQIDAFMGPLVQSSMQRQSSLYEAGLPGATVNTARANEMKMRAQGQKMVADVTNAIDFEQAKIPTILQEGFAKLYEIDAKDEKHYLDSLSRTSQLTTEQKETAQRRVDEARSTARGLKQAQQEMEAEVAADRAARAEQRETNRLALAESQVFTDAAGFGTAVDPFMGPGRPHPSLRTDQPGLKARGTELAGDPRFLGEQRQTYSVTSPTADIFTETPIQREFVEAAQAPRTAYTQAPQFNDRPLTPNESKNVTTMSSILKDKSLKKAKTLNDLIKHLAKKISGKNGPYTRAEARTLLEALVPNALNLRPSQGARWLRDNLFVTKYVPEVQTLDQDTRGTYVRWQNKIIISLLTASDKSTFLHETAHAYLDNLVERVNNGWATKRDTEDLQHVKEWLGWKDTQQSFTSAQHEKFAKGFEKYLMTGKAPTSRLQKFFELVRKWLKDIYKTADVLDVKLSPAAMRVYRNMIVPEPGRAVRAKPKRAVKVQEGVIRKQPKVVEKGKEVAKEATSQIKTTAKRVYDKENRTVLTEGKQIDYTWFDKAKLNLQDYYHPMRMMLEAVKETKGKGAIHPDTNVYAVEEAIPNKVVQNLQQFDRLYIEPLREKLTAYAKETGYKNSKKVQQAIDTYLVASHAETRNKQLEKLTGGKQKAGSGMTTEEANKILAGEGGIKVTPSLKRIAQIIQTMGKYQLELLEKGELLPKSEIVAIREAYDNYVPLKGWADMMEQIFDSNYKQRVKGVTVKLKDALGRGEGSMPDSPMINMILQSMDIISMFHRAEAGRSLLQLVRENPDLQGKDFFFTEGTKEQVKSKWKKNKSTGDIEWVRESLPFEGDPRAVTVLDRDGKKVRLLAADQKIADAFTGNNLAIAPPIIKFIGKATRFLAKLATTKNPAFVYTNPFRDVTTALLNIMDEKYMSKEHPIKKAPIKRNLVVNLKGAYSAMSGALKDPIKYSKVPAEWKKYVKDFYSAGGFSDQYGLNDYESWQNDVLKNIEAAQKEGSVFHYPVNVIKNLFQMLEMQGNALENMTRLSTYKTLYDAWREAGMPKEEAKMRAAAASRNITVNFSRRGAWAPIIGPLYMFANASIQGTTRMMKTIANNPKRMLTILGSAAAGIAMLAALGRAVGGDDEDGVSYYDKIPSWVKNTNLIFMIPGTEGKYIKIPLPYGYNIFNVMGQQIDQLFADRTTPAKAAFEIVNSAFDNFSPIGSPEAGWTTLLPTVFRPPFQLETNKGFFGQKIMPEVPSWVKYDVPDATRYWSTVSPIALAIANFLNTAGGTTKTRKGIIDISPETIEHFVESYAGGLGKTLTRAANVLLTVGDAAFFDGPELTVSNTLAEAPVIRRWFGATNFYSTLHEFNEVRSDVAAKEEEGKIARAKGVKAYRAFKEADPRAMREVQIMKAADKKLRKLRRLKNSIKSSARVAKETARLNKIEQMEKKIIQQALRQINLLKRSK